MASSNRSNSSANNSLHIQAVVDHCQGQTPSKPQPLRPIILTLSPVEDHNSQVESSKQIFSTTNSTAQNNYSMNSPSSSTSSSSEFSSRSTRTPSSEPDMHISSANQADELPTKKPISGEVVAVVLKKRNGRRVALLE
uniref:Uncharacterized protein n=1 Tax=Ditylenchus dipsaci TaxID=166011 RepID=A0A915EKQ4_9BILA